MFAFRRLCHRLSRLAKAAAQKQHREYDKWCKVTTGITAVKIQAVSDGELNMSARGSSGSNSSLPGAPGREPGPANSVLSWAVSFEKLLEDPFGVRYFTAFLKSEVSAENILFWQDCEKFKKIPAASMDKLKAAAQSIFDNYLSESAPYSVNIDDTARTEKKDLETPTPEMFDKAQAQIFKLMKMDSYRRFVRSPLYQSCTLASVEGKHLPQLSNEPARIESWEEVAIRSPTFSDKKNKKSDSNSLPVGKSATEKQRNKRGSWGDASNTQGSYSQKDPHMSVKSTSSVELGSLYRQLENGKSSPRSPDHTGGGGNRIGVEGGYCCVYLPDGSASLAPTPNGQPIKDMLVSLCEKRGFPLKDVIIYFHGKDKQPLSLDQDCSVLRDQQVSLELRVTFALEIAFTGKTTGIVAKSSKTLQDALSVVMQKHHLKPQDVVVTMVGSDEPVNMSGNVFRLANKTLRLDKNKGKDQASNSKGNGSPQAGTVTGGGVEARSSSQTDRTKTQPKPSKNRDMDGFLDMLTRAQCCRVDDQRGLLTKEQLEIPLFLQLHPDKEQSTEPDNPSTSSSSPAESKEKSEDKTTVSPSPAGEAKKTPDSAEPKPKDVRESTV